ARGCDLAGRDVGDAGHRHEDPAAAEDLRHQAEHPRLGVAEPQRHHDVAHLAHLVALGVEDRQPDQPGSVDTGGGGAHVVTLSPVRLDRRHLTGTPPPVVSRRSWRRIGWESSTWPKVVGETAPRPLAAPWPTSAWTTPASPPRRARRWCSTSSSTVAGSGPSGCTATACAGVR